MVVTANELKTRGVSAVDAVITADGSAVISVHGKDKYVVLRIEDYNRLREMELDLAIAESMKKIKEGEFNTEGIEAHMKRVLNG